MTIPTSTTTGNVARDSHPSDVSLHRLQAVTSKVGAGQRVVGKTPFNVLGQADVLVLNLGVAP